MLKKKKTTASGEPVMVQSVRRTRSRRMKFCVQRGLGALPSTSKAEGKITAGFFPLRAECINTGIACPFCVFAWMYALLPAFRPLFFLDQLL